MPDRLMVLAAKRRQLSSRILKAEADFEAAQRRLDSLRTEWHKLAAEIHEAALEPPGEPEPQAPQDPDATSLLTLVYVDPPSPQGNGQPQRVNTPEDRTPEPAAILEEAEQPVALATEQAPEQDGVETIAGSVVQTCNAIREALRLRSGKPWSVTRGRGTASCWITITAPPSRWPGSSGYMSPEDAAELGQLLGLGEPAHQQGVSVAGSRNHRIEYLDRAAGRDPRVKGEQYWD